MDKKSKKIQEMRKMGFSQKTLSLLSESQITFLLEKIKKSESKEAVVTTKTVLDKTITADVKLANYCLQNPGDAKCKNVEIKEAEQTTKKITKLQPTDQLPPKTTVQQAKAMVTKPELTKTVDTAKNFDPSKSKGPNDIADDSELAEAKKKKKKYNPWAVCTASVGRKNKKKFEDCVMGVKDKLKEGKNPYKYLIESKMEEIVEKHLAPKMTKSELMSIILEKKMMSMEGETKTKEKEKVTTKPKTRPSSPNKKPSEAPHPAKAMMKGETMEGETETAPERTTTTPAEPKTRPAHPGRNPNPDSSPAPAKAKKDEIINAIMKLLGKGK